MKTAALLLVVLVLAQASAQDVLTYHNDNARTGQNLNEHILTPSNVNVSSFGLLFSIPVDGKVDAQPLYKSAVTISGKGMHNVLFVATEHDSVYAFDADLGTLLWHSSLLKSGEAPAVISTCLQVNPVIGITSTPVIDASSGTLFAVAMSQDSLGNYFQRLHALDIATGLEKFGGPKTIQATYPGTGDNSVNGKVVFAAKQYKERPALLLNNGIIYTSWSSHCDIRPYTGWVIGYSASTLGQVSVLNLTPNGSRASMWQSGAGPAADSEGNIYLLLGNGTFETTLNSSGFPDRGDFGNAFMKLSTAADTLTVADYFDMFNTLTESSGDLDLGSGGALVLPDMTDAQGHTRHLAIGAGKDRSLYLVDRDNMGKFNASANKIYQELPAALGGQEFGMAAYFNGRAYYGAVGDVIRAFAFSNARLLTTPVSQTSKAFGYPGTTPSISANGTSNAILWAAENGSIAVLHAFNADELSQELYNSNQGASSRDHFGTGNKFIVPTISNGNVYVGTTSGVGVFGLLPTAQVTPLTLSFITQLVGTTSATQKISLTNKGPNVLEGISAATTGDFAETNNCGSGIAPGLSCSIMVTFHPTAIGTRTGSLTIKDRARNAPKTVTLSGTGTIVSLSPFSLVFASQPVGSTSSPQAVTVTNHSSTTLSISGISTNGNFAVQTKTCGTSLAPGQKCAVNVVFHPLGTGSRFGHLFVDDNGGGSPQTASLRGTGS